VKLVRVMALPMRKVNEDGNDAPAGGAGDDGNDDADDDAETEEGESTEEGGVESTGRGGPPMAETDTDANNAGEMLVDKNATERTYGRIPALNENLIMPFGEILEKSRPSTLKAVLGLMQRNQRLLP
jgi:hypothetical protein